jgi:L-alanine-DL-glutamate epimerase-like enolase superfamily enzyme
MTTTATAQPVIADARAELWRYPLDPPMGIIDTMDLVVTTLTASDGRTGVGFVPLPHGRDDLPLRAARAQLERFVAGRPLPHPVALWREIAGSLRRTGHGPYYSGLASIDVAAWDLYAKSLGVPLGVAMGGAPRRVQVYASGGFARGQDPGEAADVAERYLRAGARGVKVRAGGTPHDAKILNAVAARIGGKIDLMVDANERPTLSSAARLLRYAAEAGARFVEEPLAVTEHAGFAALARTTPVPIATGENLRGSVAAAPYLLNRWCSVIQPDLASMGGLTECLRTAQIAEHCNVEVAPHFLPGLFVQLAMAAPHLTWLEDLPTIEALFAVVPRMDPDGYLTPPDVPGHGLVLSEDARAAYRID